MVVGSVLSVTSGEWASGQAGHKIQGLGYREYGLGFGA